LGAHAASTSAAQATIHTARRIAGLPMVVLIQDVVTEVP
jgi:hypothetical protein